jgi:hypothetical protein
MVFGRGTYTTISIVDTIPNTGISVQGPYSRHDGLVYYLDPYGATRMVQHRDSWIPITVVQVRTPCVATKSVYEGGPYMTIKMVMDPSPI